MRRVLLALLVPFTIVAGPGTPHAGAATNAHRHTAHRSHAALVRQSVSTGATSALARVAHSVHQSLANLRVEWQRVAWCEVHGNWAMQGPTYSGIGFLASTWQEYGGTQFAYDAGAATEDEQILIGMRVTGDWVPDQNGCNPYGW